MNQVIIALLRIHNFINNIHYKEDGTCYEAEPPNLAKVFGSICCVQLVDAGV